MAATSQQWDERAMRVAGTELAIVKGGSGKPLLVLHDELGHAGWLNWHSALARNRTLWIPLHPGFGKSPRLDWIRSIRDLACFYSRALRELQLAPVDVIGFSLGGWIAAEMAANDARQFGRMTLVAPLGIKPPEGEIMDMFVLTARKYLERSVFNTTAPEFPKLYGGIERTAEQYEAFEDARAEVARLAWQPYVHNLSLANLLEGVSGLPTLLIWGKQDAVIPVTAGEVYRKSIGGAELVTIDGAGHRPEIEKPDEFISRVAKFLD
jgi:pimeloyl-ACP methyl ester carboxylesterase